MSQKLCIFFYDTFYAGPFSSSFVKTAEYIKQEKAALKVKNEISHDFHMTMIDEKVATIITDTSSASIC